MHAVIEGILVQQTGVLSEIMIILMFEAIISTV